MEYDVKAISEIVKRIVDSCEKADEGDIPVGVSNRHPDPLDLKVDDADCSLPHHQPIRRMSKS